MKDREKFRHTRSALALLVGLALAVSACGAAATSEGQAAAGKQDSDESVATIGGKPITRAELDAHLKKVNPKAFQDYFDAQKQALEMLLNERVMAAEAATRGTTPEALQQETLAAAPAVSDADVEKFYNDNQGRMQMQSLDAVRERIRGYLVQQGQQQVFAAFVQDLRRKQGVVVQLQAPRVEVQVAANDPFKGSKQAKVTIVEFSDFQCPFCARVGPTLKQIESTYGDKVQIVFRDFPLTSIHPLAQTAAEAANCATEQGKFWEYHDRLFENQAALQPDALKKHAAELGMDAGQFNACFDGGKYREDVMKDMQDAQRLGVTGTPAFFVNGRFLSGAQPFEAFAQIIDEELGGAGAGTTAAAN